MTSVPEQRPLDCFVIGEGTLPIRCAELLLAAGYQILGIISLDTTLRDWAVKTDIPDCSTQGEIESFLSQQPFDYLFSIVNPLILPQTILKIPRQCAINYHNGPLPKYAGSHATSWALLHQEKTHGVTWHVMDPSVDTGEILKQMPVSIEKNDTAFTLNAKCYEAAIDAFGHLIHGFANGQIETRKQDKAQRTFFPRGKKPGSFGLISFNQCAHQIDALVRALDFGAYPNSLTLPKLALDKKLADLTLLSQVKVQQVQSKAPPGTIIAIEPDSLKISTTSYDIALHQLLSYRGQPLSIADWVNRLGLHVGYRFVAAEPNILQRAQAMDVQCTKHEAFWVKRLATLQPIALPYGETSASCTSKSYHLHQAVVSLEVILSLKAQYPTWNGDFLLAALAAYLARLCGSPEAIDIGLRHLEIQQPLVGLERLFACHVPLRIDITQEKNFQEFWMAFQQQLAQIASHQTFPWDLLPRYPLLRSLSEGDSESLFPVLMERVETMDDYPSMLNHLLTLIIPSNGTEYFWYYDTSAFSKDSIARLVDQFEIFLQGIADNPHQPISHLPLLTAQEQYKILVEWNQTQIAYPQDICLHELFSAQVQRTPEATAAICADQTLTYQQLDDAATHLAFSLQRLGVTPESLVGICMERSLDVLVGLLGILKAGGAYVPLDPTYPQERLAFMLSDSQVSILLTQASLVSKLPQHSVHTICLDTHWKTQTHQESRITLKGNEAGRKDALHNEVTANNLAYVIYTSGSTGQPKGVMITHRSVVNTLLDINRRFQVGSGDRVLALSSLSFDLSVYDIFGSLAAGGTVVFPRPGAPDPAHWLDVMQQAQITLWNSAPAVMEMLVDYIKLHLQKLPLSLRLVLLSGDSIPITLPDQVKAHSESSESIEIISLGGATEAAIWSICYPIGSSTSAWLRIPYGKPLANQQFYILNPQHQPVPVDIIGELYIGGVGVARGYLNRPKLNAEKFLRDPFQKQSESSAGFLYKTGDQGRYRPDGTIEFLGRTDHQIKIRGFRIELGEIEAVLVQHPMVQQAVVIPHSGLHQERFLVAYVVPSGTLTEDTLRQFLKPKLPDYMIPAAWVLLDALPLTPNGKIDRQTLLKVHPVHLQSRDFVIPQNALETQLAKIWENVLGIQPIGIRDNFFELGGESLLAIKLFSQIEQQFDQRLPLATLFEAATVESMARRLRQREKLPNWSALVPINPAGSKSPFFCIHGAGGSVLYYRPLAHHLGQKQTFYGLQAQWVDGDEPTHTCIEEMAAHYVREILAVQPMGSYRLAGHSLGGNVAFEMAQQLQAQRKCVEILALIDTTPNLQFSERNLAYYCYRIATYWEYGGVFGFLKRLGSAVQLRFKEAFDKETYQAELLWKEHTKMLANYQHRSYQGNLILFQSTEYQLRYPDIQRQWAKFVSGDIHCHAIQGNHDNLLKEPFVQSLARQLSSYLK
jgi:amino acid adenylation domain-containing protein